MVSIQVGEISDISMVSDDKNEPDRLLISSGKFSFSHLWGVSFSQEYIRYFACHAIVT